MPIEVCPWCGRPCTSDHPDKCGSKPKGPPMLQLERVIELLAGR
jgi:hypothetical protein